MQDTSWKDLGSVLEHLGASSEPFLETFWGSFGQSGWGTLQQNSVFCCHGRCSNDFLLSEAFRGCFWVVFGSIFGCSELLFYGSFCRSQLDVSIVVVALCTSHTHLRHFASQHNVSTTSDRSKKLREACFGCCAQGYGKGRPEVLHCGPISGVQGSKARSPR